LSAVLLAKEGMKVCVLERDKQIGGCLQTFSFEKRVFDSSVHYIGGLGEGHSLWHIFKYAGIMNKLSLAKYDPNGYDRIVFANETTAYPHANGSENFVEQLLPYFPKEKAALNNYISTLQDVADHFPLYRLKKRDIAGKAAVSKMEVVQTIKNITQDVKLQNVLAGNNILYAGMGGRTPFYVHALVQESYIHSAHKVLPGSSSISKYLWQELEKYGGEIFRNTEINKLVEENGLITYAESTAGQRYYAKNFISNIHPKKIFEITDSSVLRPIYRKRISGLEQTISSFMLNIAIKPTTVPMRHSNLYWNAAGNAWAAISYDL